MIMLVVMVVTQVTFTLRTIKNYNTEAFYNLTYNWKMTRKKIETILLPKYLMKSTIAEFNLRDFYFSIF
jgi:hypothetical protein